MSDGDPDQEAGAEKYGTRHQNVDRTIESFSKLPNYYNQVLLFLQLIKMSEGSESENLISLSGVHTDNQQIEKSFPSLPKSPLRAGLLSSPFFRNSSRVPGCLSLSKTVSHK